jgi:hypothetical protein
MFYAIASQLFFRVCHYVGSVNQHGLKLNVSHRLLVYADYVDILGGNVYNIQINAETFLVGNKEIGPELNTDKTKYKVMPRFRNTGRSRNIKFDNSPFEKLEDFK